MEYLLDTVTLIRYLSNTGKLPQKVKNIFDQADNGLCKFNISTISFMEILYLAERKKIPISLEEVVNKIRLSSIYKIINLSTEIVLTARSVDFYELHDRLILATAKYLDIPVISSDSKFKDVKGIKVTW
jgi:PIN domain nuclease of toxin-antitoxin system